MPALSRSTHFLVISVGSKAPNSALLVSLWTLDPAAERSDSRATSPCMCTLLAVRFFVHA